MKKYIRANKVTDEIDDDILSQVLINVKEFGRVGFYRVLDNMMVETSFSDRHENIGPHGAVNVTSRYWKFVKSLDGWSAYEVSESGKKIGQPFNLGI